MIDLHSHILPGLDDGVKTLEASVELARSAAAAGVEAIAATPHVREDYPTTPDAMQRALDEVRARISDEQISIQVLPGGELGVEQLSQLSPDELRQFGLGGNPRYLLVEAPYYGVPIDFEERLIRLRALDITPVLAHPERSLALREDRNRLGRIVRAGALIQLTAGALAGTDGRRVRKAALALLDAGLAHLAASDSHGVELGRAGLDSVHSAVSNRGLADWLTSEIPSAIVNDAELPPRPSRSRLRVGSWRRG
jgi:protein-tyrosine phosphatase